MSDFNKVILSGRVVRDVEVRVLDSGTSVADLSICSNRVYYKEGEKQEEPTFVDITLWGKQAESLSKHLKKGTFIMVDGRLRLDQWSTDEGVKRSRLRVIADKINFGPKSGGGSASAEEDDVDLSAVAVGDSDSVAF